ncbi:unnamed protein product, partial [Larinioides sclopetarius]
LYHIAKRNLITACCSTTFGDVITNAIFPVTDEWYWYME